MAMTLIADNTADTTDLASVSFTSSIDSTYKLYIFKFYDVNPATDGAIFQFQGNASSQSGYNETITSTSFRADHDEVDSFTGLNYTLSQDQAQGTAFQNISQESGGQANESTAGELFLFNPSNTTYVTHFYGVTQEHHQGDNTVNTYTAGYFNVTAAIINIQFKMSSGNMDGVIKMYGVG
jgi:hypothetical protein